jgi:glycosyltransferase involved in cell wall biosynthesis
LRCVIVNQVFHPETVSTGTLLTELAEALVERGVEVTAIAGQPTNYDFSRVPWRMRHRGIDIVRPPCTWFRKDSVPGRIFNHLSYLLGALVTLLVRRERGPLLICTNPPLLGLVGYLAKRFHGARYVCLIHDVYPEVLYRTGFVGANSFVVRLWDRMNRLIFAHADRVVALGARMAELMADKDPRRDARERVEIIPNWSDGRLIVPKDKQDSAFFRASGVTADFALLYSGNFGRLHNVEILVEAMDRLQGEDMHLMFIGGGHKRPVVEEMVARKNLQNVTLHPYQPQEAIGESLTACDVQVAVLDEAATGLAVPCKLYGMLASGKPLLVVCDRRGEMGRVVETERCGLVVAPGDLDGLVEAIRYLRDHPQERAGMGRRARQAFESRYTLDHVADRYVEVLRQLQPERG